MYIERMMLKFSLLVFRGVRFFRDCAWNCWRFAYARIHVEFLKTTHDVNTN